MRKGDVNLGGEKQINGGSSGVRPALLFALVLAAVVPSVLTYVQADEAGRLPAPKSMAEIRESVLAVHNLVRSLEIRYCVSVMTANADDPVRQHRHHLAVKDHLRFRENVHFSARRPPSIDINHTKQYFTGETADVYYVKSRYFETSRNNASLSYAWKIRLDPILACLGWWPEHDQRPPESRGKPAVYLRFALAGTDYVVRRELELVDGCLCYVVEAPTLDRLWLDPRIGFAIRKRETCDPVSGAIVRRQTSSQFRKCVTDRSGDHGFWIPTRIRVKNWTANGVPTQNQQVLVEDMKVNQVKDDLFKFSPPPGTLIADRDTGKLRQISGGVELLDETVALAQQLLDITGSVRRQDPISNSIDTLGLLAVWTVVTVFSIGVYLRHTWRRPSEHRTCNADEKKWRI